MKPNGNRYVLAGQCVRKFIQLRDYTEDTNHLEKHSSLSCSVLEGSAEKHFFIGDYELEFEFQVARSRRSLQLKGEVVTELIGRGKKSYGSGASCLYMLDWILGASRSVAT
jgi:hypothetical protein